MALPKRLFVIGMDGMNYPLLREFIGEGVLPTFSSLLERGSLNRLLPTIPAWTPTNWSSAVTGAPSGTTQLGGWVVRHHGDAWDAPYTMSWDHAILGGAETIWDVADAAGMSTLITHFPPACWNAPLKHGYVVAPGVHDAPFSYAGGMSYYVTAREGVEDRVHAPGEALLGRSTDVEEVGAPPGSSVVRLSPAAVSGWSNVGASDLGCTLPIVLSGTADMDSLYFLVDRGANRGFQDLRICAAPDGARVLARVPLSGWSDFAHFSLGDPTRKCAARFCVLKSDAVSLHLVRSVAYATEGFTQPAKLGGELIERFGPFYDRASVSPVASEAERSLWLDELRYMGEWQARVAGYVQESYGWDLHFSHWHPFDWINHATANGMDPLGPDFDPERAAWLLDAQRKTYQLADDVLRQFLELAREDDIICVMSDHGITPTHRAASVPDRLVEEGLMVIGNDGRIDYAGSVAYVIPARGCEVYVNMCGREPNGIVATSDYERVQESIIDALVGWRDPVNDRRPIALALKLQDAQIIGYWGPVSGDVVFVMNRGYGWGKAYSLTESSGIASIGATDTAIHGSQIPTSETAELTNMACCLLSGPGIRTGYERDAERWGLMRMIDMAPTFAHLLGLRPPRHSTGAVLHDLLVE